MQASVVGGVCQIDIKDILAATIVNGPVVVRQDVVRITINGVPQTFPVPSVPSVKVPAPVIKTPVKVPVPVVKPPTPVKKCTGACVPNLGICAGGEHVKGVLPCCSANYKCVPLDKSIFSQCRKDGKSQSGTVLPVRACT